MIRKSSLLFFVAGLMLLSWLPLVDDFGDRYTTKALTQATVTYGITRGINSVVSVLQSTEVSIGIASVSPGEFLDPLNDLIERFSWITMMAMASLGFQKLLLLMASSLFFKILLTVTGSLLLGSLFLRDINMQQALLRFFVIALFLRFAVGGVVFANNLIEYYFLEQTKAEATQSLSATKLSLNDMNAKTRQEDSGFWNGLKNSISAIDEEEIKSQTENATSNILDLTVAYIAQAIIFPLLFLWGFYRMMIWIWRFDWATVLKPLNEAPEKDAPAMTVS